MTKKMDELLARHFGGATSQKDMEVLECWLSEAIDNQKYFDELTSLYRQIGHPEDQVPSPNTALAKAKFIAYMNKEKQAIPFYKHWMFQAASILILLTISVSIWYFKYSVHDNLLTSGNNKVEQVLTDGTRIILSKNSRITYRSNYGKKDRIIHLSGEATIVSGHRGAGRLQIVTDLLTIEDIGTIFTISAYPENPNIVVSVKEGLVNLITQDHKSIRLKANETCQFNRRSATFRSGKLDNILEKPLTLQEPIQPIETTEETAAASTSTKVYDYQFDSKPLSDVVETLKKDYGVNIEFEDASIGMQEITVHFDHEKIDIILQVVAETMNLKVHKVAGGYRLSSN